MGRIFLIVITAGLLAGFAAWYFELVAVPGPSDRDPPSTAAVVEPDKLGDWLYSPTPEEKKLRVDRVTRGRDPVVVQGHLIEKDTLQVSSKVGGLILFIGDEVPEGVSQLTGVAPFLNDNYKQASIYYKGGDWIQFYRPLHRGEEVAPGQMVAKIDFAQALYAHLQHETLLAKARVELEVAERMDIEAKNRLRQDLIGAASDREKADARLTAVRTEMDVVKNREEVKKEQVELENAKSMLAYHGVRPKREMGRTRVKNIHHDTGEAVKELDPILQLYSIDRLVVEAFLDIQYADRLRPAPGQQRLATIEPVIDQEPLRRLEGHRRQPITAVSFVQHDDLLLVVSAGEDGYVKIWRQHAVGPLTDDLYHGEPIRSMTCSPPGIGQTLCLVGMGDGKIHVWDLFPGGQLAVPVKVGQPIEAHQDGVTALAFSLDGKYFASGAADGSIKLWQTDGGKLVYAFDAAHGVDNPHQGTITSLHFTPQSRLVSAGRDNALRVWNLKEKGAHLERIPLAGRSGTVHHLGVSRDGRTMLFDQGKSLQLLSVADGRPVNWLRSPGGATPFETLAVFAPDSTLILAGGLPEGRLQLWRPPAEDERGFEVRQFTPDDKAPATCAAFAPSDKGGGSHFAASGTKDGIVYLWPVPTDAEIKKHLVQNVPVTLVSNNVEAGSRQVLLRVDIPNLDGRLTPGRPATIVFE